MEQSGNMRCFRWFNRLRTRHHRSRHAILWAIAITCLFGVYYLNQNGIQAQTEYSPDNRVLLNVAPNEGVDRAPKAINMPPNPLEEDVDDLDLRPDLAPATLHYIWCGKRAFEYKHYLAIKSANRAAKPDKIFFYYENLPEVDDEGYYLWFNQTLQEIDHLLPRQLNASCPRRGAERYLLVLEILEQHGGIYVPEDALWVDFPVHLRINPLVTGVTARNPTEFLDGIIVAKRAGFKKPTNTEELLVVLSLGKHEHGGIKPCVPIETYANDATGDFICVTVTSSLFPRDIWEDNSKFGMLARVVAYGVTNIAVKHNLRNPIPRIAHYICLETCEIKFITYLSMLSSVYVAGLHKVYLHGVREPSGKWWQNIKDDSRFMFVYREYPETFHDKSGMTKHLANGIMKLAILLKYGGVYQDPNVLWTKKIDDHYFGYDVVVSPDWHLHGSWPDSVNHGAVMSKRNSEYLMRFRSTLQKHKLSPFWYVDHFIAYRIIEKHPDLVNFDRHFQVKCLNHNCHPTWQPHYRSGLLQNKPGASFNWQNDTMSIHWTDTFPELDIDMIKYTSGTIVDVSRNILATAGIDIQGL
ncbi:hypothetical protein LOTGIDRAFT_165035 [Lottia gigantea]|uniref:Nucleotide-diphospho-sugar transferase domain-containing protein n=1 Tax=Lottia gigantea TaxID=225164 RepID=V3ZE87_LOTGI|nr:hypothetical protein LOTGIDRAFT_165035 [Lottia gigantea]ESO89438.1 hypothetical protein LOTGIDRAFT_165035 [Lottia gigantea]